MKASPAAAAVPARNTVGRLQKSGNVVRMPKAANRAANFYPLGASATNTAGPNFTPHPHLVHQTGHRIAIGSETLHDLIPVPFDAGPGMNLLQDLRATMPGGMTRPIGVKPEGSKVDRMRDLDSNQD
jgi:hypothetical protein